MKHILPLLFVSAGLLFAQEESRKSPEERAKIQTQNLTEKLDLSPEQAEKIHAINLKYAAQADEKIAKAKADGKKGPRGKGAKKHMKARDKEIQGILNKDQKKKFKKMRKHQKDKMKDRQKKRKGRKKGRKGSGGKKPY